MNVKRIFGVILILLGIIGLIYCAVVFSKSNSGEKDVKNLIIYGVLGIVFFFSGLGLIRTTKDEA